jgi:uncharacterized BrkB/YihY/UPF0761 family membrane protein
MSLIQKIEAAFNHAWRLEGNRNLMQRFSNYLSVVLVGPVLIFSAVGITASLSSNTIIDLLNQLPYMNDLLHLVSKLLPYLLVIGAFMFIYLLVPNTRVKIKSAFFGALVAGFLWESVGVFFTSFVGASTSYLFWVRDCPDVYDLALSKLVDFTSRGHYCLLSPASRTFEVATNHNPFKCQNARTAVFASDA